MAETSQQGAGTSGGAPASAERSRSQRHIVWDESNLEENERIKATLNPIKITEPKTPFHGPSPTTSETMDEEMRPLVLGHASEMLAVRVCPVLNLQARVGYTASCCLHGWRHLRLNVSHHANDGFSPADGA